MKSYSEFRNSNYLNLLSYALIIYIFKVNLCMSSELFNMTISNASNNDQVNLNYSLTNLSNNSMSRVQIISTNKANRLISTSLPIGPNSLFYTQQSADIMSMMSDLSSTTSSAQMSSSLTRRICYFANWAPYREISPPLYPDNIDPSLCTHIHYAFAKIDPATLALVPTEDHDMNWTEKSNMPLYIRLYGLRRRNMALKILLAVGGNKQETSYMNNRFQII
jgi:hypothetical protein